MTSYSETDQQAITDLLIGHSVAVVGEDRLRLDNGTVLEIQPNQGGCACSSGDYDLTALNGIENIITRVEFEQVDLDFDKDTYNDQSYRIFVYAGDERINLISVDGSDGNGYYGTGYEIYVRSAE